jgi:putative hydrolase of the HAD superfamily
VLFDLYGTLIDIRTDEDDPWTYAALAQSLAYLGAAIGPEELQRQYKNRVRSHLERSPERFPDVDVHAVFREILREQRQGRNPSGADGASCDQPWDDATEALAAAVFFRSLSRRQFAPFPDVHAVLERLRTRYRLGLVSDAQWVFTEPELAMADLDRFFPVRILSSRMGVKKPDPRPFTRAMSALGVAPESCLYVGDNPPRDLVGARNAGIRCVLFRGQDVLYNGLRPDACFDAYADLEAIVDRLLGG